MITPKTILDEIIKEYGIKGILKLLGGTALCFCLCYLLMIEFILLCG